MLVKNQNIDRTSKKCVFEEKPKKAKKLNLDVSVRLKSQILSHSSYSSLVKLKKAHRSFKRTYKQGWIGQ